LGQRERTVARHEREGSRRQCNPVELRGIPAKRGPRTHARRAPVDCSVDAADAEAAAGVAHADSVQVQREAIDPVAVEAEARAERAAEFEITIALRREPGGRVTI